MVTARRRALGVAVLVVLGSLTGIGSGAGAIGAAAENGIAVEGSGTIPALTTAADTAQSSNADRFSVSIVDGGAITKGAAREVTIRVRYHGNEPARNVVAKLFIDDPFNASDDTARLDSLAPGETRNLTFTVHASASAAPKTSHTFDMDFRYDRQGSFHLSKTHTLNLTVLQPAVNGRLTHGDGTPVTNASAVLVGPDGNHTLEPLNATGGFAFTSWQGEPGLSSGAYVLGVVQTDSPRDGVPDVAALENVSVPETRSVGRVTVPDADRVTVTVVNTSGAPVSDVAVNIASDGVTLRGETTANGRLKVGNTTEIEIAGRPTFEVSDTYTVENRSRSGSEVTLVLRQVSSARSVPGFGVGVGVLSLLVAVLLTRWRTGG
jgi:PGF-CTERM protein